MSAYRTLLALSALILLLTGCAIAPPSCPDYYGSGTSCSGSYQPQTSNADIGAIAGGAAGALMVPAHPVAGALLLGAGGLLLGQEVDYRKAVRDAAAAEKAAAVGRTDCTWQHKGTADQNGKMTVTSSSFDCRGGNSAAGNRIAPPQPTQQ